MKVAFRGQAATALGAKLRRGGLELEVVPLSAAEVLVADPEAVEASRPAAGGSLPVVWVVPARTREWTSRARKLGVFGLATPEDDPLEVALLLENAVRWFRERRELSRRVESLERALEARKTIERAKGWLMDRYGLKEKEAFSRLRRLAMDSRRPLAEVAEMVLLVGDVEGGGGSG